MKSERGMLTILMGIGVSIVIGSMALAIRMTGAVENRRIKQVRDKIDNFTSGEMAAWQAFFIDRYAQTAGQTFDERLALLGISTQDTKGRFLASLDNQSADQLPSSLSVGAVPSHTPGTPFHVAQTKALDTAATIVGNYISSDSIRFDVGTMPVASYCGSFHSKNAQSSTTICLSGELEISMGNIKFVSSSGDLMSLDYVPATQTGTLTKEENVSANLMVGGSDQSVQLPILTAETYKYIGGTLTAYRMQDFCLYGGTFGNKTDCPTLTIVDVAKKLGAGNKEYYLKQGQILQKNAGTVTDITNGDDLVSPQTFISLAFDDDKWYILTASKALFVGANIHNIGAFTKIEGIGKYLQSAQKLAMGEGPPRTDD